VLADSSEGTVPERGAPESTGMPVKCAEPCYSETSEMKNSIRWRSGAKPELRNSDITSFMLSDPPLARFSEPLEKGSRPCP